jgi:hypothetical protein
MLCNKTPFLRGFCYTLLHRLSLPSNRHQTPISHRTTPTCSPTPYRDDNVHDEPKNSSNSSSTNASSSITTITTTVTVPTTAMTGPTRPTAAATTAPP